MKKKVFTFIGYGVTLVSLYYIYKLFISLDIDTSSLDIPQVLRNNILPLLLGYSLFTLLRVFSWKLTFDFTRQNKSSFHSVAYVHFRSNIAKYIPGNVMHFVGRNILGKQLGWNHGAIVLASLADTLLLLCSAILLACALLFQITTKYLTEFATSSNLLLFLFLVLFLVLLFPIVKRSKNAASLLTAMRSFTPRQILFYSIKVILVNSTAFCLLGIMLGYILTTVVGVAVHPNDLFFIVGAYTLSWMIGFLTPGSPGGLGVREAIILLLLSPIFGENSVLLGAMLHRIVSIAGDCFFFLLSCLIGNGKEPECIPGQEVGGDQKEEI